MYKELDGRLTHLLKLVLKCLLLLLRPAQTSSFAVEVLRDGLPRFLANRASVLHKIKQCGELLSSIVARPRWTATLGCTFTITVVEIYRGRTSLAL